MKKHGTGKLLGGVAIGAALGLLFAPKTGSETRKELKKKIDELIGKAKEIDVEEVKQNITERIQEIKEDLADLDKEKMAMIAKRSAKSIKEKCDDLVDYAVKKGTPVLQKTAKEVKEKTVVVLKEVVDKLEQDEKKKTTKTKKK